MGALAAPSGLHVAPIGGAATAVWAGRVADLDENDKTRGENWRGTPGMIGESQKMLNDPHVRAARDVLVDPVVAAEWDFEPSGGRPKDLECASYLRHAFFERGPWHRHLGALARAYTEDGFAIVEETDDLAPISSTRFPLHPLGDRGIIPTDLQLRPGWSITWFHQNPRLGHQLRAVTQFLSGSDVERAGLVEIPIERLIRATWEQRGAEFDGCAPQRSAWGPWFVKRLLTKVEAMGHERNHLAQPIAKHTEPASGSDDEDKKVEKILANFRAHERGSMVLPFGFDLTWSQHGQQTNIGATIQRSNFDIAHNYLAGFMMLGQNATGSYALAGTQKGQFDLSLGKHANFICDVHNFGMDGWSLIGRIARLNYGDDVAIPRLVVRYLPTVDFEKVLPILGDLSQQGLIHADDRLERFARRGLRAPDPDPSSTRTLPPPAPTPKALRTSGGAAGTAAKASTLAERAEVGAVSPLELIESVAAGRISRASGREALTTYCGVTAGVAESLLGPPDFLPRSREVHS